MLCLCLFVYSVLLCFLDTGCFPGWLRNHCIANNDLEYFRGDDGSWVYVYVCMYASGGQKSTVGTLLNHILLFEIGYTCCLWIPGIFLSPSRCQNYRHIPSHLVLITLNFGSIFLYLPHAMITECTHMPTRTISCLVQWTPSYETRMFSFPLSPNFSVPSPHRIVDWNQSNRIPIWTIDNS